ncbi:MAG: IS3 family transposase [Actinobacteria bacterium]|nr:IS3 family transposase [Actinomycetota bacterium]
MAEDRDLRRELRDIARRKPRWGYRRAHGYLRENGQIVNRKRVQRLWREEGPAGAAEDAQAPADGGS